MPARSKAQQEFFAIAEHERGKLRGKRPDMTRAQMHEFAATSTKRLPEHVKKRTAKKRAAGPGNRYDALRRGA